jgi:hypothetical protein
MAKKKSVKSVLAEIEERIDAEGLLTAEEKGAALLKAAEHIKKERKKKALDDFLSAAIDEERRKFVPEEHLEDILIDLPKFAPYVAIDGVQYYHGIIYTLPFNRARSVADIMARAWEHQNEIDGRKRKGDEAMKPRMITLRDGMENINTSSLMRI